MRSSIPCLVLAAAAVAAGACDYGSDSPMQPDSTVATVTISYVARTTPRTDMPADVQACVQGSARTHIHPSWRGYPAVPLQAATDRWQITFDDVPVNTTVAFRVNDPNACDENATGAVTRNIFANNVRLTTMVLTPGSGPEPGFSFTVTASGQIQP